MRKIQSEKLYAYLEANGVLGKTKEDIAQAKRQYRKEYKLNWVKQQRSLKSEVRFFIDKEQFLTVKKYCSSNGTNPTSLARELLITHCQNTSSKQLNRKQLLKVYQLLGLLINSLGNNPSINHIKQQLIQIEEILAPLLESNL